MKKFVMDSKTRMQIKRRFCSFCRNFESFDNLDQINNNINAYIEELKKRYINDNNGTYYYRLLKELTDNIIKKNYSIDEILYILVNSIDPELKIYRIYESNCKIDQIKKEVLSEFSFYDEDLPKLEKLYINKYCDSDKFDFTKKLELI